MQYIKKPQKSTWKNYISRPSIKTDELEKNVREILDNVSKRKDIALKEYGQQFDGIYLDALNVSPQEIEAANSQVPISLKEAIQQAKLNIEKFHLAQQVSTEVIETMNGVSCWRKNVGIESVGLYIPGGSAPLFSTILMLGIPAKIAGCKEIILCTPPDSKGRIHPAILYTASLVGITSIFKVGGAQAIGAMAYGTESVPQVYKIFGPGNQYVTKAKELIQQNGVAIDMPAGPSEVLIVADSSANASYVASDLLSQAEHGPDSQVLLLSPYEDVILNVQKALEIQLKALTRREIARCALKNSKAVLLDSIEDCMDFSNQYAPEHLIIASDDSDSYIKFIQNAGSVFLGHYSCESAGDYASGTNHTLPTNGFAKSYSGVSLDSFLKKITFQKLTKQGLQSLGSTIEIMAEAEGLMAHKNAVTIRLKDIENEGC